MKKLVFSVVFLFFIFALFSQNNPVTKFKFGGYLKADFISTWTMNGKMEPNSLLRDFHLPSLVPVGEPDQHFGLDFHVKESRFNFDVETKILKKDFHTFIELDFLLSASGNERVTNSFNPRLRHFYLEWDRLLVGQTWSTFMIAVLPDEIDFTGAMDGLVFIRQPQLRYKAGNWWFSMENPETTVTLFGEKNIQSSEFEFLPDFVVRRNFSGNWGNWGIAAIYRTLHLGDSLKQTVSGYGITTGGKIFIGKKGSDVRLMATYGSGLGRYVNANFISSGAINETHELIPTKTISGYLAYNQFWVKGILSSSFSVAYFNALYGQSMVDPEVNQTSYSLSGNLKWDIVPMLRIGLEYMHGFRGLKNGTNGSFHRVQLAVKYKFGYQNRDANEKK
jgi:hypothetical protein